MDSNSFFRLTSLGLLLLTIVLAGLAPGSARASPGWYNASWDYRKKITINSANVSADLTDFPVLINLASDSDLASDAQDNGNDILFTAADEVTRLSHEIESFNGTSGQLVAWVKVPNLSSATDTELYMYYGNSESGNSENMTAVWDSNYKMVQHLQETTGGANAIEDSTSNANHGTDNNSPTFSASGQIDGAISFDGIDDDIKVNDSSSLDITNSITLEAWVKPVTDTNHRRIMVKSHSSWAEPYYMYSLWVYSNQLGFGIYDGTTRHWQTYGAITDNVMHYVAGTYNGTHQKWYINGVSVGTDNFITSIATNNETLLIGNALGPNLEFDGTIDEVRISNTARSSGWILTSYNNQNNPSAFITLGAAEARSPASVGGIVYPVNKLQVMAPWLFLLLMLSLAITTAVLYLKVRIVPVFFHQQQRE